MKRRSFLTGVVGTTVASAAEAAGSCYTSTPAGPLCRVYVQVPKIVRQKCAEWCWAASAAMIFAMGNHEIDQAKIVEAVFGQPACLPTGNIVIAQVLSRQWTDDDGDEFQASLTAAYDFSAGVYAITNDFIVDQIKSNKPLLYGNGHHAMVLSQVDFIETPNGPVIQSAGVFDPWPWSPEFHLLSPVELVPSHLGGQLNFLAAVDID